MDSEISKLDPRMTTFNTARNEAYEGSSLNNSERQ